MSSPRAVDPPIKLLTLSLTVECDHCALPVPINGPTRVLTCGNCQKETRLAHLHDQIVLANEGWRQLGSPYKFIRTHEGGPRCRKCAEPVPIDAWIGRVGERAYLPCPACGTKLPTYPAPEWLSSALPNIRQVFGGEPEIAAGEAGLVLELAQSSPKPIAMACPQCAGGLLIQAADERVVECRYCKTSVFLPDELWRRLHPAKTVSDWTVAYTGRLVSTETLQKELQEREDEERERLAEAARMRAESEAALQRAIREDERMLKALEDSKSQTRYVYVAMALLIVGCVLALLMN